MKFIPMLFSTAMVQAIREGRKTQTRRIMKPQISDCKHEMYIEADWKGEPTEWFIKDGFAYCEYCGNGVSPGNDYKGIKCPYGQPGDVIWVKETHYAYGWWVKEGSKWSFKDFTMEDAGGKYYYETDPPKEFIPHRKEKEMGYYKRPSLFMPKEAARIFLKVVNRRVERLQEIYENDAKAEGVISHSVPGFGPTVFKDYEHGRHLISAYSSFASLWRSINGSESWDANPWVWVVEFVVIDKPENFI